MIEAISLSVGVIGLVIGVIGTLRVRQWEKHLRGTRITVAYKNKVKLNNPLIDWWRWAQSVEKDKQATGQVIYRQGNTAIAILRPVPRTETKTRTIKES